ncbi:MAG: substrate-binding domain-containing protein [Kineosporiaceae bacterium]
MTQAARPVERLGGGPRYQQVRQDLLARVRRGEFAADGLLPSESQLCQQYDVSVTTARRALLELVKDGVVRRRAGVGTMLAPTVRKLRLEFVSIGHAGEPWRRAANTVGAVLSGIGEYAWGHDAALHVTGVFQDEAVAHLRALAEERSVDGVLVNSVDDITHEHVDVLEDAGLPYVVIKRGLEGRVVNCVRGDDRGAARLAVDHVLGLGHERVGFVRVKSHLQSQRQRLAGYREALAAAGLPYDEALVRTDHESTSQAVRELLESPDRPTAVLLGNAAMASAGYRAAKDLGLAVPDDVAFVGFRIDDSQAAGLDPALTTVTLLAHDLSYTAARLLIDIVEGRETAPQERVVEAALVVGGSTRDLRAPTRGDRAGGRGPVAVPAAPPADGGGTDVAVVAESRRVVVMSGRPGPLARAVGRVLETEGARVVWEGDVVPDARASRPPDLVHHVAVDEDVVGTLRRAREHAERLVAGAPPGGRLLVVVHAAAGDAVAVQTVRAGLEAVVGALAASGVAVNAVLADDDAGAGAAGPAAFLLSDAAAGIRGQVLVASATGTS